MVETEAEQLDEKREAEQAEEVVKEGTELVAKIPKIPRHMTPAERKRLEEAATKRIGEKKKKKKKAHQLKVKELKANDAYKLHVGEAANAKTGMHMYEDKLKENKDLLKADVDESEGHFKLTRMLDAVGSVLKTAAMHEASTLIKEQHQIIDTEAQNAAKEEAALGLKHLRGLLIAKLRQEVDDASKATAVKLAQAATSKEVRSEQASFAANLTAEVKSGALKDARRVAKAVVAKALFSTAGLAGPVAELGKFFFEKHSMRHRKSVA